MHFSTVKPNVIPATVWRSSCRCPSFDFNLNPHPCSGNLTQRPTPLQLVLVIFLFGFVSHWLTGKRVNKTVCCCERSIFLLCRVKTKQFLFLYLLGFYLTIWPQIISSGVIWPAGIEIQWMPPTDCKYFAIEICPYYFVFSSRANVFKVALKIDYVECFPIFAIKLMKLVKTITIVFLVCSRADFTRNLEQENGSP